jgi:hypothetical protein
MTYCKPEVLALGQASSVILGGKTVSSPENGNVNLHVIPDADLDE